MPVTQRRMCRFWVFGAALALFTLAVGPSGPASSGDGLIETVKRVEERLDARVGVAVYDRETGGRWRYRADERFPLTSTFKVLACAALLHQVDTGRERLDRVVPFDQSDLVTYSPVTERRVGAEGMTLSDLCHATMSVSDNTAANLILEVIGGPAALTAFVRSLGDAVTRLDRWETDLNEAAPGDKRDTTSPHAMATTLATLVLGDALSPESRRQLTGWLEGNQVGDALFRAGVPSDWTVADRTGAGGYGSRSIAAVMGPPDRAPIVATVYITETDASFEARNAAIAEIGAAIAGAVGDR